MKSFHFPTLNPAPKGKIFSPKTSLKLRSQRRRDGLQWLICAGTVSTGMRWPLARGVRGCTRGYGGG
ncbi:hypothetical protein ES319_A01G129000v1 [Gossypium barbadense]|uniref:Uncharacterized protein n=2 Tax=Gossypium TaxID=3633 RepID=A0A5J5WZD6_GOSBA|nr:hypothetical protein ES319_A01G129000v1 [Gossypium barbadense]TYH31002.1 hypothetical protein ES288_A01G140200v1 [Gossypium darwinii]